MKDEQLVDFTRRISQSNRSGLTVVTYEIFFAYMEDARAAYEEKEWEAYKEALRKGSHAIEELIGTLNFSYELAGRLYRIYLFCKEALAAAMYKRRTEDIEVAVRLMGKLYDAFVEAAKTDDSAPLMQNTQQVYAGYTYGRDDLVETFQSSDASRGFFV